MHGGDIYRNKVELDFSVNISPYGIPASVREAVAEAALALSVYPDEQYERLRKAIGEADGVDMANILCGNGASELIDVSIRALAERDSHKAASLLVPSFSSYESAFLKAGFRKIKRVPLDAQKDFCPGAREQQELLADSSVIVLGNPNNPTGKLLPIEWLTELVTKAEDKGIFVILDETFLQLTEQPEVYQELQGDHLIKIRAYTKCMAIPGVRLGYLICQNTEIRECIRKLLPDWNVSVVAEKAGIACAQAKEWLIQKVKEPENGLHVLRSSLKEELEKLGLHVFPSDTSFLLLQSGQDLYEKLLKKGILIRDCRDFEGLTKGFYRVAVKCAEDNEILINALSTVLNNDKPVIEKNQEKTALLKVQPADIEKTSFSILSEELARKGIYLSGDTAPVIKRCIHTTADFQYAHTLSFSENAVEKMKKLLREGACVVTDTNMALAGINKTELRKYGGEAYCFMADPEIAAQAKQRGCTRATVSMEHAATLGKKVIFAVGNAPTALVTLCEMMDKGIFLPDFVIGVPVGFVNVEQAKEMVMRRNLNYIVNRGRKGGSNVAAAIVNAVLYEMRDE